MLIDTHIHLDFEAYQEDREEFFLRAKDAGVSHCITIGAGDGISSLDGALDLSKRYPNVFASMGVHPQDAGANITEDQLLSRLHSDKIVAIGETGLDFFRDHSTPEDQKRWFRFQIELAKERKLPLIVHSRNAGDDCLAILKELRASDVGGVFHCYSEDDVFAEKLRDINFLVSFTGTVTFKKADALRNTVSKVPLSQIMVETDGPFMAPEPFRGRRSESAHVRQIAEQIAKVKNVSFEEVAEVTTANAKRLFQLPI